MPSPQYAQKEFAGWVDNEQREGRGDFGEMGVEGPDSKSNAFLASLGMKGVGGMGHTRRAAGAHARPSPSRCTRLGLIQTLLPRIPFWECPSRIFRDST